MEAYSRVSTGSLKLKGKLGDLKKYKKKERRKRDREALYNDPEVEGAPPSAPDTGTGAPTPADGVGAPAEVGGGPPVLAVSKEAAILEGTGRIVATGETVQGFHTKFRHEIEKGDTLVILHPATLLPEETLVASVETDRTLHIHQGFSKDFISTTTFKIKKTAAAIRARAAAAAARKRARGEEETPEGDAATAAATAALNKKLKKGSRIVSVREKKGMWGYTVRQVRLRAEPSAEEKLDLRCKQGRDKFCW